MSDLLGDILKKKDYSEPFEVTAIKQYVQEHYSSPVGVQLRKEDIIITVPSAALAGTLRLEVPKLRRAADTDKKLFFRIG